ncbi:MAG TPA: helix-turn-helix domain-containing protein [Solirubrobacter sp.]|nr:helix-turn-helix domain-containing protein [Solirubrobacter sp.]
MGRWEPNARGRLAEAAMALYGERGFEQTTVAEIAERAGLTERTFFRHFADKREVLFSGSEELRSALVDAVESAPASAAPLAAVVAALAQVGDTFFAGRRDHSRRRQAIIDANAELRERELIKLATLASALAGALRRRGVPGPVASLAAETGIAVFKVAFERWVAAASEGSLAGLVRETADQLSAVAAPATEMQ